MVQGLRVKVGGSGLWSFGFRQVCTGAVAKQFTVSGFGFKFRVWGLCFRWRNRAGWRAGEVRRVQEKCVGFRVQDLKHLGVEEEQLALETADRPRVWGLWFRV